MAVLPCWWCVCVYLVSPSGSCWISFVLNGAYKTQFWIRGWGGKCWMALYVPEEPSSFFRHYKGCNVFWYNVSLAKVSSISFISLSPRGKHVQEHGKEESCFFTVPLFSLPFCGVGLKPKKAPCHARSQASTFLPCYWGRETTNTMLTHDKESLICFKVFWGETTGTSVTRGWHVLFECKTSICFAVGQYEIF